ncbi:hypothetical protein F25303_13124 [Fusarium sp. NRRL 25303]|nr:hypothetical protein F25303_13124 [Fusarium sp. NRRL 25303]
MSYIPRPHLGQQLVTSILKWGALNEATENEGLCKLHTNLQGLAGAGPSCFPDEDSSDSSDSEDSEVEITTKKTFEEFTALVRLARKTITFTECEESQKAQGKKLALRNDIGRLMREVVRCAKLCDSITGYGRREATPANTSNQRRNVSEWYRSQPLRAGCQEKAPHQKYPLQITTRAREPDFKFEPQLLHLKIPAFHLYKQHRMAQGMFDLSLRLTYSHLEARFSYGTSAALENYPFASAIHEFLNDHDGLKLPPDTMSPVFVNCKECPCRIDKITKSKNNPRAITSMMVWLEDFVKAVQFPTNRIVATTPYRSNLWHIQMDVKASTIDSYHGRENDMVVLCLAVDKGTGPCFTAQPQRPNVAISRHKLFLVIFGDIETSQAADTTQVPSTSQSIQATVEGGAKTQIRSDMFNSLIKWFKEKSRVVHVQGGPSIDPDE